MDFPEENVCLKHILQNFIKLIDDYQFTIELISNKAFNVKVIYANENISKRIEIVNQTNYTDYGFSIFVHSTNSGEDKMLMNIPFTKQDKECRFIKKAAIDFFNNIDILIK